MFQALNLCGQHFPLNVTNIFHVAVYPGCSMLSREDASGLVLPSIASQWSCPKVNGCHACMTVGPLKRTLHDSSWLAGVQQWLFHFLTEEAACCEGVDLCEHCHRSEG